jgi:hypothetical protein
MNDLDAAFQWISGLRKKYSANSDVWNLRRNWENIKVLMLAQLNDGSYQFSPLARYEFSDATLSLWSSEDMIALKLITQALQQRMGNHIPKTCYHVKGHGGLKKAVQDTYEALPEYQFVMRSDIKSYYQSIRFDVLMDIIKPYVTHPVLLNLLGKACRRTETSGGIFYDYEEKGIPKGSPLSPLLGAVALIPLDKALGQINGVFYLRFMDDWLVFTKSKTALRKIVKITHKVVNALKLRLHPSKTWIGKISHGFNFLAYYMDDQKILPAKETIRRFSERAAALYERSQAKGTSRHGRRNTAARRDISVYEVNEAAPTEAYASDILARLMSRAARSPDTLARMRRYLGKWARWLKLGISTIEGFDTYVQSFLPCIFSCWMPNGVAHATPPCR